MFRFNKVSRILLLALCLLVFSTIAVSAADGKVNASNVKFRKGPGTGTSILDHLAKNTPLNIVGKSGDWVKVTINSITGYVHGLYVTPNPVKKTVIAAPRVNTDKEVQPVDGTDAKVGVEAEASATRSASEQTAAKTVNPAAETVKPAAETVKPAAETEKPSVETEKPVVETEKSAAETEKSAAEAEKSAADTVKSAVEIETEKSAVDTNHRMVTANTLNIRKTNDASSEKLGTAVRGDEVTLIETIKGYAKIKTSKGIEGYVLAEYLSGDKSISRAMEDSSDALVNYALSLKGVRYVYGGSTTKGFDCSGFVKYVYKHFGITTPRSSYEYAGVGVKINLENLRPGDILLFDTDGSGRSNISHVGIYVGNDVFVHASTSHGRVVTQSLSGYQARYLGARRLLR